MRHLILVRHSETRPVAGVVAREWPLTEEGRARCVLLAERLRPYALQAVVTSPEGKAVETGRPIGEALAVPLSVVEGLQEHDRAKTTAIHAPDEWHAIIRRLFENPAELVHGSETADQAHERFSRAVESALARSPAGNLAIVTHATVMTLFLSRAAGLDPFALWLSLAMPAYAVLSLPDLQLVELVPSLA
jgi:broad specificity phosphatase PhoE